MMCTMVPTTDTGSSTNASEHQPDNSPTDHAAVLASVDGPQTPATVGPTTKPLTVDDPPTLTVPEQIGAFTHRPVPNENTTTWRAVHGPHDPDYSTDDPDPDNWPHFITKIGITCATCAGWGVTRSVATVGWSTTLFAGTATTGPTYNLQTLETLVDGLPDRETALAFAIRVMRAESPADDPIPAGVTDAHAAGYREMYGLEE